MACIGERKIFFPLAVSVSLFIFLGYTLSKAPRATKLLDTDALSAQWAFMNKQPVSGPAAAEQQYLDTQELHAFRREHESMLRAPDSSKSRKKRPDKSRGRNHRKTDNSPTFYEPSLPSSATQGWSDLLSRVTRELASDTFDIEEMRVWTVSACLQSAGSHNSICRSRCATWIIRTECCWPNIKR